LLALTNYNGEKFPKARKMFFRKMIACIMFILRVLCGQGLQEYIFMDEAFNE